MTTFFRNTYNRLYQRTPSWLISVACGAVTPLSFAPFNYWWVGLLSIALFTGLLCRDQSHTHTQNSHAGKYFFYTALAFAIGYYGTGVSWIYVSIYYFGSTPFFLAILLTALFVAFVAVVFALPFYALRWTKKPLLLMIGIPFIWVLSEWIRTWIFTGFPWLLMGYSHINTGLSGWAPVGGVLLVSLWGIVSSSLLCRWLDQQYSIQHKALLSGLVLSLWLGGYGLQKIEWTQALPDTINVGLVQPNIPQDLRWAPEFQEVIKERLLLLSEPLWDNNDWIIWPEGVIPNVYHRSLDFIQQTEALAEQNNTTVITGVLYDEPLVSQNEPTHNAHHSPTHQSITKPQRQKFYNSIIGIGDSDGIYHKQRLVPFGEYVPLEDWIRGLIDFFDLPFSVISSGPKQQDNLRVGLYTLANAICYEIAYPALVATQAKNAHVLLTVSNDAWFGDSIGPLQHFQMVRMRAIENGRYIIRGTNNGVSAIIDPKGKIHAQSEQFIMTQTQGRVVPMTGTTPYMFWKNYLLLGLLLVMGAAVYRKDKQRENI